MTISFSCSGCGKSLRVPDRLAGKRGKCPHCLTVLEVPDEEDALLDLDDGTEARTSSSGSNHDFNLDALGDIFKMFSDTTRLAIVDILRNGPTSVGDLCEATGNAQPTVSHHLGLLRSCRVVRNERKGKQVFYSLDRRTLKQASDFLQGL